MYSRLVAAGVAAGFVMGGILAGCSTPALRPNGLVSLPPAGGSPAAAAAPARAVAVTTVRGPAAPAATKQADAVCPAGDTTSGGGIATTLVGGGKPPSSLHADAAAPAAIDGRSPASAGSVVLGWVAVGATGGQLVVGGVTTSYAICLHGRPFGRPRVVVATVPGPAVAATTVHATASCAPGEALLGGGGLATVVKGSASPSLHLIGSYPSDSRGSAVGDAASDPVAWSALADAGGRTGAGVETVAFAICVTTPGRHTEVVLAARPGPLPAGTATSATASCPSPTELISGGAETGSRSGTPQQGLHLTGSFPSDAGGIGVGSSSPAAGGNSWTARAESGGQGSPAGTATTAFAVCMKP